MIRSRRHCRFIFTIDKKRQIHFFSLAFIFITTITFNTVWSFHKIDLELTATNPLDENNIISAKVSRGNLPSNDSIEVKREDFFRLFRESKITPYLRRHDLGSISTYPTGVNKTKKPLYMYALGNMLLFILKCSYSFNYSHS